MKAIKDFLRRFDGQRRCWTLGLERATLAWLAKHGKLPPSKESPKRIIIVRSTSRLGNNLFLLPFLHKVRAIYPDAEIDLVCAGGPMQPFFESINLQNIYKVRLKGKHLINSIPILWHLRNKYYDRVYVPFPSSTDHFIAAWVKAREKFGFDDAKGDEVFEAPQRPNHHGHYAHQPLQLLGINASHSDKITLGLSLSSDNLHCRMLRQSHPHRPFIGFFTDARKGKGLTTSQWQLLLQEVRHHCHNALLIQINDPECDQSLLGETTKSFNNLKDFAHFTAELDLFISCDTGPLHIAAASGVPCIGLFTQTDPERYGCLGPQHLNLVVTDRNNIPLNKSWLTEKLTC
ncbi:glycosyltransferase family 9 protein [Aeromonas piscicola]|uniref:glycosyltransferase family 9 protein n=1 Tax=Aeromonas piscicola TaxID=600645 RepID=UPI0009E1FA82|nr:glycosyltransferase family 9 protein [Aeromonas piscicola]